jgi:predicted ATPase/class 3 adenylate cyclase
VPKIDAVASRLVPSLPTGTVTFLFTDLEGSTRRWEEHPEAMPDALVHHDVIVREAIESHGGVVYSEMGDGMAAVFASPGDAIEGAVAAQLGLADHEWGVIGPLRARMGLHAGEGELRADGHYVNQPLNRCARLMAIAHGGQIVVSATVASLARTDLPTELTLVDLGEHRLRDLTDTLQVFQVVHPELGRDFPPLRSLTELPGNLPRQITTFVGREAEIESLAELVRTSSLVTLTGVGGVGKTRLALQVAAEVVTAFPDGAWLCEFGPVTDPEAVWDALAASLRVQPYPGRNLDELVIEYLAAKRVLLVLDNAEHLLDAVARQVDAIVRRCERVAVLVTSREGLALPGERIVAVRSLAVPADNADVAALADAEAVRLFSDRASAARHDFVLDERNAGTVGVLCRRLDGIPLAIELAAARVRSLSPEDLVARLDQRFKLLTGGSRAALERHQTLRSTIDWSYDLLDLTEQKALDRLSVFAGGSDLQAAEAVLAGDDLDELDIIDTLGHLVDKSLVIADTGDDGSVRYRLLESIRQYARERLEASGDTAAVRRRHANHYAGVAEAAAAPLRSPDQLEWAEALSRDTDNLRVLLDWAIETASVEHVCRMIAPFTVQGLPIAYLAMDWAQTAVRIPGGEDDPRFVVVAAWAAWGATMGSDLGRAAELIAVAERAQGSGAPDALLLRSRAVAAYFGGDFDRARDEARSWVTATRASEDHFGLSDALIFLGVVLTVGAPDDAREAFEEALSVARADGIPSSLALNLSTVAGYLPIGESERAVSLLDEAIDVGVRCGDHMAVTSAIAHKGVISARRGDWRSALAAAADATEPQREIGDVIGLQSTYMLAAAAFSGLGHHEEAAVVIGKVASIETLTPAFFSADLFAAAEARSLEVLGDQRFATLIEQGTGLDHNAAVAYLRTEADRVLEQPAD